MTSHLVEQAMASVSKLNGRAAMALKSRRTERDDGDEPDNHRNAPKADPACLYGLTGDIARAGSDTTEANPFAVALNALAYLGCCLGRGPYLEVGNTYHHARLFTMHVGRSGCGRKGDAVSLLHRLDMALRPGARPGATGASRRPVVPRGPGLPDSRRQPRGQEGGRADLRQAPVGH